MANKTKLDLAVRMTVEIDEPVAVDDELHNALEEVLRDRLREVCRGSRVTKLVVDTCMLVAIPKRRARSTHEHDWKPIEGRSAFYECSDAACRAIGMRMKDGRMRTFKCDYKVKGQGPTCKAIAVEVDGDLGVYTRMRCAKHS